jgi:hypothetical protein
MSILRVEQDQIEFFTFEATGLSGMSETGLARLVGVSQQSVHDLIQNIITGLTRSKCFKPFAGKNFILQAKVTINGKKVPVSIIPAHICAVIINYYAFISDYKTETAYYSSLKFTEMGIERWIQGITGWKPQIAPELTIESVEAYVNDFLPAGKLAVAIHPGEIIKLLQQSKFSADGYRLYLYLEMLALQAQTPSIDHICDTLNISMSTFKKWLPQVHEWSRCADWIEIRTRQGPEFDIQTRMHQELGGDIEVHTIAGRIDLVTATEVIEIKRISHWKDAFGEVLAKGRYFPHHQKRIHLFGEADKLKPTIVTTCEGMDILATFEPVALAAASESDPWAEAA